jgi:hypothetical protein
VGVFYNPRIDRSEAGAGKITTLLMRKHTSV